MRRGIYSWLFAFPWLQHTDKITAWEVRKMPFKRLLISVLCLLVSTAVFASGTVTPQFFNQDRKEDILFQDNDSDGNFDPGDTIQYEIEITNTGTDVMFTDTPDPNTTLIVGPVTTTQGAVTSGNGVGDTEVMVILGDMSASSGATVTFRVMINNPLPVGLSVVSNQGRVSWTAGGVAQSSFTDDPATPGSPDPTVTPLDIEAATVQSLNVWGMGFVVLLIGVMSAWRLKRLI